ncbi:hypothetical protein JKP88DRAFT_295077 [Tribonema minus]|uniref:Uncharacterized protein n=1 Tax=Tribonema minus TaxID=303371 RepID=A0A835ZCF9_9STRA|nr:hypothetical protein JKP88DRAFT_295077 [Tribonema minus]
MAMCIARLLLVTAGLLLLCVKVPVSAGVYSARRKAAPARDCARRTTPLDDARAVAPRLFGSERAAEAVPTQPATTETPTPTPAAPARDKYFGPDDIIASEVYACPEGQFITSIALYAEDLVGGMAFMKCAATGAKPKRQELKIGTRNPARGGRRVNFASATGFDGAVAGAVYDDALCPGCSYDGRFVAGLALRRAASDARDWTYTAGSHNACALRGSNSISGGGGSGGGGSGGGRGRHAARSLRAPSLPPPPLLPLPPLLLQFPASKFPLKPFYCPPGTKIVALRVAARYDRLAPSPFISGFGVVCGEPAAA